MGEGSAHATGRQRATLWCKMLGKLVEASLVRARTGQAAIPGAPEGWGVAECLDKDVECFGRGCLFTTDGGESPFGEMGESVDLPPEALDPPAKPGFERGWS